MTQNGEGDERVAGSPEHLQAVGAVTVNGTAVEEFIYEMAEALDIADCRRMSAVGAVDRIKDKLKSHGVPPWAAHADLSSIRTWCSDAKQVLNERHDVVHASYKAIAQHDGTWVDHREGTGRRAQPRRLEIAQLEALAERLRAVQKRGLTVSLSLTPKLADGVYAKFYGVDRGDLIVTPRADGSLNTRPTQDELAKWLADFDERWGLTPPP